MPKVSLITPAYNQANFLAQTIDSVLAQDYPNLEYTVLDDGSTDDTPAVLARYGSRLNHRRHANMGQAATLNLGWRLGAGSLLGYLSSDDRLAPDAISRLVRALTERPDAMVAYGDFTLIDAHGKAYRNVQAEDFNLERLTVDLVCQPGPGALFRRSAFDALGGWSASLRQTPDFEFWLRVSRLGPFVRVPALLAEYRVHDGSASFAVTAPERSDEVVRVMKQYWAHVDSPNSRRSLAKAHMVAAKSHGQSGRAAQALQHWAMAGRLSPAAALSAGTARALASGFLRRPLHKILGRGQ
jgi:glycosyltransferase involved in cell wall biosynthesis